ncbi:hypothetical protein LAZ40_01180 [Cereibacter sphaeroides]|uniref:calcium-binding protein n=1 Tax=Cereibacter sphaeroides TaxID=1063 RepID=UPI001F2B6A41|nr:hypothetical protein [Cereibacter sphaeroides]MCE6957679.1 hypothetical protein [Cereibacter sphaeroides]MCE6971401.1 hypothetical protein [Cereibacter sphaeroides]
MTMKPLTGQLTFGAVLIQESQFGIRPMPLAGVRFSVDGKSILTDGSGPVTMQCPALGTKHFDIAFSGQTRIEGDLDLSAQDIRVTTVNGYILNSSASLSNVTGASDIRLLGTAAASVSSLDKDVSIIGNGAANILKAVAGSNTLLGEGGNDRLIGGTGKDLLKGGSGNDTIVGGAGDDRIDGGSGTDTVDFSSLTSGVTVDLARGTATSAHGKDSLTGIENVTGSAGSDRITGNLLSNVLKGGAGNDALNGGYGNDTLDGGTGTDLLTGGAGSDVFVFAKGAGKDMILDFEDADTIRVDRALSGGLNAGDFIAKFGKVIQGDAVFTIGGDTFIIDDLARHGGSLAALADDIIFV